MAKEETSAPDVQLVKIEKKKYSLVDKLKQLLF